MLIALCAVAVVAVADFGREGPARKDLEFPDMKIRVCEREERGCYEITEDAPLFRAYFATVDGGNDILNYAERKQLAVEVAKSIAAYLKSTNDIRIVHWEQPPLTGTNLVDAINAMLKGEYVTDEIVPVKQGVSQ